ncbi:MAG: sialate O-acetylesterase [Verrucomicrobiales bacterium]|nr:sialate O-acetylesterase [Verrucomicrobiales bacterium]
MKKALLLALNLSLCFSVLSPTSLAAEGESATGPAPAKKKRAPKPPPEDLNRTPFVPADVSAFPGETDQLEIFLLMGQSNMKGRGVMPAEPLKDPQIIMLHKKTDEWFHARHPLHHVGDPEDFSGSDNAGVGPGLAFAQTLIQSQPNSRIALIPCAVGGTSLGKWQKGERLYEEAVRRAKLAMSQGPEGKTRLAGALWLQGESDSTTQERIDTYASKLKQLIADLRADTGVADLPFIACTIGELKPESKEARAAINAILLDLPNQVPTTACVDSREFSADIGDRVHFDTATQERHGALYSEKFLKLVK